MLSPSRPMKARRSGLLDRFRRDRKGVSALEFALIAPILILAYFGMAELSEAMMAQRRVSHATSAIGDLVAQTDTLQVANLTDIFSVGGDIMTPFPSAPLKMRLTSIVMNSSSQPQVAWSQVPAGQTGMTAYAKNTNMTVPLGLLSAPGDSVILAESSYAYASPVNYVLPNGLPFNEIFYLKPRKTPTVTCSDC